MIPLLSFSVRKMTHKKGGEGATNRTAYFLKVIQKVFTDKTKYTGSRENVHSVTLYKKYLTRLGASARKLSFLLTENFCN